MSRSKVFLAKILELVSYETDVTSSEIMSRCSKAEIVDARWICVKLLNLQGYYPSKIAELMGITTRYVHYILTCFGNRLDVCKNMRNNYERVKNKARNQ